MLCGCVELDDGSDGWAFSDESDADTESSDSELESTSNASSSEDCDSS